MAKMYTLDKKLLIGSPVIQIGDTGVSVTIDDRTKTVRKVAKLSKREGDKDGEDIDLNDELLKTVLTPADYKKVEELDLPFAAYQQLIKLATAALTGDDPEEESFREERTE